MSLSFNSCILNCSFKKSIQAVWDSIGSNILFSVKSPLTDTGNSKSDFFSPSTTFDEGLGTSSPAEMPYPTQASASEARQLKRRLMVSSRSLAAAAAHTTEVWAQGFWHRDLFLQRVSAISDTSAMLLRQRVCWRSRLWLISACRFTVLLWLATPWIGVVTPIPSASLLGGILFTALRDLKSSKVPV